MNHQRPTLAALLALALVACTRPAVESPIRGLEGLARALERPLEGGQAVREVLSGVAWYRLDLPLAAERHDPGIGEGYLEAVRRGP